jgi:hypothetical protein
VKNPFSNLWSKLRPAPPKKDTQDATESVEEIEIPCCSDKVHIAYRGISDDRLYLSNDRKWQEVKFFKPNGLRVFCADCRRRIY